MLWANDYQHDHQHLAEAHVDLDARARDIGVEKSASDVHHDDRPPLSGSNSCYGHNLSGGGSGRGQVVVQLFILLITPRHKPCLHLIKGAGGRILFLEEHGRSDHCLTFK